MRWQQWHTAVKSIPDRNNDKGLTVGINKIGEWIATDTYINVIEIARARYMQAHVHR